MEHTRCDARSRARCGRSALRWRRAVGLSTAARVLRACRSLLTPWANVVAYCCVQMFQTLYGQTAAALYAKAAGQNAQARQLYNASADTYYKANDAAAYDDWVRARNHWDYFYNRS